MQVTYLTLIKKLDVAILLVFVKSSIQSLDLVFQINIKVVLDGYFDLQITINYNVNCVLKIM